ncbi:MAG: hypothetical protein ACM30I_11910 [Gemmatimonas sp.]
MSTPDDPLTLDEFEVLWRLLDGQRDVSPTYKLRLILAGYIEETSDGVVLTDRGRRRSAQRTPLLRAD